jgi:Stealth protein CR2, conserved region 2/Stealth protein CR1, conserved region 1
MHGARHCPRPGSSTTGVSDGQAIDAVVLWVDGDDPAHRAKLDAYLRSIGRRSAAAAPTRFGSVGEIDYCLNSLLRFAPFLRRVHVVTDQQCPPTMRRPTASPKLNLVDHRDIFRGHEERLPTFSSRSIESMLHRIPGLAPRFVYLNDDFMLLRPVDEGDFFDGDRPVLRGNWKVAPERRLLRRLRALLRFGAQRAGAGDAQAFAARIAGMNDGRFFAAAHAPYAMRRDTLGAYFDAHPEVLEANVAHRLRDARQFTPTSLSNHLELRAGTARIAPDAQLLYVKPATQPRLAQRLEQGSADARKLFVCLQSLDDASPQRRALVIDWLDRTIGR